MRKSSWIIAVAAVVVAFFVPRLAHADLIDFSTAPAGPVVSFTIGSVTFSAVGGGGAIISATTPNGTTGILDANIPRKELRADIVGGATSVSIDLGDFDADADTLFLEIFNSSNVSLGFTSLLIDASFTGMDTLTLSASDIAYAEFGARTPALGGSSVFADNFEFTQTTVPEPSAILLLGTGLAGVAGVIRRKLIK